MPALSCATPGAPRPTPSYLCGTVEYRADVQALRARLELGLAGHYLPLCEGNSEARALSDCHTSAVRSEETLALSCGWPCVHRASASVPGLVSPLALVACSQGVMWTLP